MSKNIDTITSQPTQEITGYWIPAELTKLGLTKVEQFLLAMIASLEAEAPNYCLATNKCLSKHMDLSESRVSFYITKFKRMGLIEEVGYDGRRRSIRTLKQNWFKPKKSNQSNFLQRKQQGGENV